MLHESQRRSDELAEKESEWRERKQREETELEELKKRERSELAMRVAAEEAELTKRKAAGEAALVAKREEGAAVLEAQRTSLLAESKSAARTLSEAKVCGWGVYYTRCDFLQLPVAPCVSCSCLDALNTPSSKFPLSPTVSHCLPLSPTVYNPSTTRLSLLPDPDPQAADARMNEWRQQLESQAKDLDEQSKAQAVQDAKRLEESRRFDAEVSYT